MRPTRHIDVLGRANWTYADAKTTGCPGYLQAKFRRLTRERDAAVAREKASSAVVAINKLKIGATK